VIDVDSVLHEAGLKNSHVRDYVRHWAELTGAERIEVINADDDPRLLRESVDAGEIFPAGEGRYYSRSYVKDTARSEERTVVSTSNPADAGIYNNWRPSAEMRPLLEERMRGASAGKTMYVVPYLMAPPGSPLEAYAAGVELTDCRTVVLHMIRMARVGVEHVDNLAEPGSFVRGVHVTGDLETLGQGTPEDQRYFVTVADERTILHYGSSYGGNALLGKIAHGLRQAAYDGWTSGKFLAEQFMLLGITDKETGRKYHICGGFPSASGKTNLAMMLAPDALGDRYHVQFYGDDIAWLRVDPEDGRVYAINPEFGVFGVAKDTNEATNPTALAAVGSNTGALFTNVAYNENTGEVWWEGRTPESPADITDWRDWTGRLISERPESGKDEAWAHPNSRFTTTLANVPNIASDFENPRGVPVDAIIFGGRTRDREPLVRAITDLAEGVYDGLTLGAEATFAAEGVDGQLRYDPMSMRPFMAYSEGAYDQPLFAHVNWFQRDPEDDHFLWPGYRDNLRALLWLMRLRNGEVTGTTTPVGIIPTREELELTGSGVRPEDLDRLLTIDVARWRQEMVRREQHLAQFDGLPEAIWEAHRRVTAALDAED
jgi:phosphoenolpyruvate carboxykinase (GTP)